MDSAPDVVAEGIQADELPLALQVEPVAGFESLGTAELRELSCWELQRVVRRAAPEQLEASLLGACLWINGRPLGLERALALPGRLYMAARGAVDRCVVLHGMDRTPAQATPAQAAPSTCAAPGDRPPGEP